MLWLILPSLVIIIDILSDCNYTYALVNFCYFIVRQIWKTEFIITDKYDLFEATKEIGDWFTLCTSLRVSQAVMNDLRNTAGENLHKRQDCLTSYFNKKPKTLWKEVVQVIAESMENRRLACEIAKKHMKWEEKDCELAFSNSPRTEL